MLNASFDISQAGPQVLAAFRGAARKTLFNAGDRLYRLTSLPAGGFAGNGLFTSPWWYTPATYHGLVKTATRTNSSLVDTARARLAVTREWNPTLEWLVIIQLTQPAYGWVGAIRHQPAQQGDRSVLLPGSAEQVFMPGLARAGDDRVSDVATIFYYGSIAGH
jgi:hypothetical protein